MKKFNSDCLAPISIVLIVGLSVATWHLYKERNVYKNKANELEFTAAHIGSNPTTFTEVETSQGTITVATTEPLKATEKVISERNKQELAVAKEANGVKPKDVSAISHVETTIKDSVRAPVIQEPFGGLTVQYNDNYATIEVRIDSLKTATMTYEFNDSLVILETRKRHSILFGLIKWKGRKTKVEAYSKNPKAKVKSLEVIQRLE